MQPSLGTASTSAVHCVGILLKLKGRIDETNAVPQPVDLCIRVIDILTEALGRQIAFAQMLIEQVRRYNKDMTLMLEWFGRVGYSADIAGLEREYCEFVWLAARASTTGLRTDAADLRHRLRVGDGFVVSISGRKYQPRDKTALCFKIWPGQMPHAVAVNRASCQLWGFSRSRPHQP